MAIEIISWPNLYERYVAGPENQTPAISWIPVGRGIQLTQWDLNKMHDSLNYIYKDVNYIYKDVLQMDCTVVTHYTCHCIVLYNT